MFSNSLKNFFLFKSHFLSKINKLNFLSSQYNRNCKKTAEASQAKEPAKRRRIENLYPCLTCKVPSKLNTLTQCKACDCRYHMACHVSKGISEKIRERYCPSCLRKRIVTQTKLHPKRTEIVARRVDRVPIKSNFEFVTC